MRPQDVLIAKLNHDQLSHQDRLLIGQKLAEFGDPRDGVGAKNGLPDIIWIEIPGGQVKLEGIDHVFVVKSFRMAKYPVTNAQFQRFLSAEDGYRNKKWWREIEQSCEAAKPSWYEANGPCETVSWYEAVAFCRWLSVKTGTSIRLPTEWEWQQAATEGDPERDYPWEGKWDGSRSNSLESRLNRTTAVGMYPVGATTQGIYDMVGNVWEWCLNEYQNPEGPDAVRINKSSWRVVRGGSWDDEPGLLCASARPRYGAVNRFFIIGFRLVQDIP